MTDRPAQRKSRLPIALLIGLVCLAGAYFVVKAFVPPKPVVLAQVRSLPLQLSWHDGDWYWIESVKSQGARLVRTGPSGPLPNIAAPQITVYTVADGKVAWTEREGNQWTISIIATDGSGKRVLRAGPSEPRGLCLTNGRAIWLEQTPAAVPGSGVMPPLGSTLQVVSAPVTGGAPQVVTTLMEEEGGQVIGVHDAQAYVTAYRPGARSVTVIYRVPLAGGAPRKIAGEAGRHSALLTRDGVLYWLAPTQEATSKDRVLCVRRISQDGKVEILNDWLPADGRLYETERGVYYVDGDFRAEAWPIVAGKELPRSVHPPEGYMALAAGGGEMLLTTPDAVSGNATVYRMPLP